MIKNLKKIVRDCVDKDWLDSDPFYRYKVKHVDPKVPHLNTEELRLLGTKEITSPRLSTVRDIFLFSCYTGFAYIDVVNLTWNDLKTGIDGKQWLIKNRQKTDISERVPILPPAAAIIEKYKDYCDKSPDKWLLPVPSNQKVNAYLKELGDICGITTKLTFHIARHTFATTVTLENGVPIDSVSRMLGHGSIKTIQIYAQITDKKISNDTKGLLEYFLTTKNSIIGPIQVQFLSGSLLRLSICVGDRYQRNIYEYADKLAAAGGNFICGTTGKLLSV